MLTPPEPVSDLERELLTQLGRQPAQRQQLAGHLTRLSQAATLNQVAEVEDQLTGFFFSVAGYTLPGQHPAPALYRAALALALHCAAPRRTQLSGQVIPESEITLTVRPLFPGEVTQEVTPM